MVCRTGGVRQKKRHLVFVFWGWRHIGAEYMFDTLFFGLSFILVLKKYVFIQKIVSLPISFKMQNNLNIVEKKYKKLVIRVALTGFSYAVVDTLNNQILVVNTIDFGSFKKSNHIEDYFWQAFLDHRDLTKMYDKVVVIHNNSLNTFVPNAIFSEEFLGSYLQFNTKVFETDFFSFDVIDNYQMNNVFVPYININNYLLDQFERFEYHHSSSILVQKLLELSKNNDQKQVFVHFDDQKFDIVVVQNQKLLLFNTFEIQTKEDFIYYLLFTAEQLQLNPENFKLQLLGNIVEESAFYDIAYRYVRHVSLLDVSDLQRNNTLSKAENLKHFILFQS